MRRELGTVSGAAPVVGVPAFVAAVVAEAVRPLRRPRERHARHVVRNVAIGVLAGLVQAFERPIALAIARRNVRARRGLAQRLPVRAAIRDAVAIALLDYGLYLWHVANHRVPFLWRWHRFHHEDRDLDASTAIRFHPIELALSIPTRAFIVRLAGASPRAYDLWVAALLGSILFHHGNVRLPEAVERVLSSVVMTPKLHGIHHSTARRERDSNWSNGLVLWDALHGTLDRDLSDVRQARLEIGVERLPSSSEAMASR